MCLVLGTYHLALFHGLNSICSISELQSYQCNVTAFQELFSFLSKKNLEMPHEVSTPALDR